MPEPTIIAVMSSFRRQVQAGEDAAVQQMARGFLNVERALQDNVELTARILLDAKNAGRAVTPNMLLRNERFVSLLAQTRQQIQRYAPEAANIISGRQRTLAALGIDHAAQAINTVAANAVFDRLPVGALTNLIGVAGDGSPLRDLLEASYGEGANGILDEMVKGVALGKNPVAIARSVVRQGLSRSLDRMIVIQRTETLRIYRTASLQTYANSGIVDGWIWKAALSTRTCAGCLSKDGSFHKIDEQFASHVQCRCAPIPKVIGVDAPIFETGEQWLARQDEDTQLAILGPGRLSAYKAGVPFDRFATVHSDPTWGDSVHPTRVRDLVR